MARKSYAECGPLAQKEKFIIVMFVIMLFMWVFGDSIGISIIETTLLGLGIFLAFGVLDIKEILSSYNTFSPVLVLGLLISYVHSMQALGIIDWFTGIFGNFLTGFSPNIAFFLLSIVYFFAQYFFSGEGAKIIALYGAFYATAIHLGIDQMVAAMTLAVFSSASSVLAHYVCPVSIMMSSLNYVPAKKWMLIGLIQSIIIITNWFLYVGYFANNNCLALS
ncbi:hypothetical protein FACS1894113_3900 [Alphaproteobacteria bacterium]|nr:hypothetical protein FACS1894113_3900 [Alphaproteobacteria bacterium]